MGSQHSASNRFPYGSEKLQNATSPFLTNNPFDSEYRRFSRDERTRSTFNLSYKIAALTSLPPTRSVWCPAVAVRVIINVLRRNSRFCARDKQSNTYN